MRRKYLEAARFRPLDPPPMELSSTPDSCGRDMSTFSAGYEAIYYRPFKLVYLGLEITPPQKTGAP